MRTLKSQETYQIIIKVDFIKAKGHPFIKMVKPKTYIEASWLSRVFYILSDSNNGIL